MVQKFYQKVNVQVAIISSVGLIIVTLITTLYQRSELKSDNKILQKEVEQKTLESSDLKPYSLHLELSHLKNIQVTKKKPCENLQTML